MAGRKGSTFPVVTPTSSMFIFGFDPDEPTLSLQNVRFAANISEVFIWTNDHSTGAFKLISPAATNVILNPPTGQAVEFQVNSVQEYLFGAIQADWKGNSLINFGFLKSNATNPATTGVIQLGNGEGINSRNFANDGNLGIKFNVSDELEMGLGGTLYKFGFTSANWVGKNIINVGFLKSNATNSADDGEIQLGNTESIQFRNPANSGNIKLEGSNTDFLALSNARGFSLENADFIQWAGTDLRRILNDTFGFIFGVETGDDIRFTFNITDEYIFDANQSDWKGNSLINVGALDVESLDVGNIRLDGNTISSTDVNGNILFVPNGIGNIGIGGIIPTDLLDIGGTSIINSIRTRSGEISTGSAGKQMLMSFNGGTLFTHSIATRHNAGSQTNNAIDFYLWDQTVDAQGVIGTKKVMTVEATGRVGILTDDPDEALDVIGNVKLSNFRTRAVNRAIPTVVDDVIGIGEFDFSDGAGSLWISVTAEATGLSISKEYLVPVQFDQTSNVWQTLIPISSTGVFGTQDFDIDIKVGDAVDKTNLRLRRTMGSISATANILIKQEGVDTDTFTPSTNTNSVIAPTSFFGSTVLTQVNGKVGIDTLTPLEPLDVIGDVKFNNFRSRAMTRNIPEGDENSVLIGEFDFTGGVGSLWVSVSVGDVNFAVSKQYVIPIQFDQTLNVWQTVLPISSTGPFTNHDFDLDIKVGDGTEKTNLRLRRSGGSTVSTAEILIKQEGIDTDTFTPATTESQASVPSSFFGSTPITQVDSKVGILTKAPTESLDVVGNIKLSGVIIGNTNATIDLDGFNGNGIDFIFEQGGGFFSTSQFSLFGTDDIVLQGVPKTNLGFTYLEDLNGSGLVLGTSTTKPIIFRPDRTDKMILTEDGNLGIGVPIPEETLDVFGNIALDGIIKGTTSATIDLDGVGGKGIDLLMSSSGVKTQFIEENLLAIGDIVIRGTPSVFGFTYLEDFGGIGLALGTNTTKPILFTPNRTEKMILTDTGRLGIGVSNPIEVLHVVGNILMNSGGSDLELGEENALALDDLVIRGKPSVIGFTYLEGFGGIGLALGTNTTNPIVFAPNQTEQMILKADGKLGLGLSAPQALFHGQSPDADTAAIIRIESTGTNPGLADLHVGNRNPNANVTAAGGAEYIRDSGATSGSYESLEATTGTNWFKRSVLPASTIIEINTSAQFEELATAGVITVSSNLTLRMNITVTTSTRFVIEAGNSLHITGSGAAGVGFIYIGTDTFFSGAGSVTVADNANLISGSTGQLIDLTLGSTDIVNFQNILIVGWSVLGSITGGAFLLRLVTLVSISDGLVITNTFAVSIFNIAVLGIPHVGVLFTYNTNNPNSAFVADTLTVVQATLASIFDFSTNIDLNTIAVLTNISPSGGTVFKAAQNPDASINTVSSASPGTGTITQMSEVVVGETRIFTSVTFLENEVVTISGTTTYNGTFQIFNVNPGVSFDIVKTFTTNEATGSVDSNRIQLGMIAGHGISTGDNLKITGTNFYNGFVTALNVAGNNIIVNGDFVITNQGTVKVNLSLDQTDIRLAVDNSKLTPDSMSIGSMSVTTPGAGFAPDTGALGDFNFEGNANAGEAMERWRLRNPNSGEMEYIGRGGFSGNITCYFNIDATTNKDYNVGFAKNGVDLDQQSGFINIAKATLISFTIGISVVEGDIIKPRIEVDSGVQNITVPMAAIIIK